MESPGEGMDCELECCKKKDITTEDLLNFPCSPEMDASGGGPDSGLDTSSTGCIPCGGFSSPREHTVSETSGVDLTEAAIGEDMPHDGDVEILLRKPVKSSTSSSVSSDAGTWDSTFPSTHVTELDLITGADVPLNTDGPVGEIVTRQDCENLALNKNENIDCSKRCDYVEIKHSGVLCNLDDKISEQTKKDTLALENGSSEVSTLQQTIHTDECAKLEVLSKPINVNLDIEETSKESENFTFESLPFCTEGSHSWKLSNQNNYFINAADLADDVEMLLPPAPVVCELTDKAPAEMDSSELEALQKSSSTPSPCEETISSTCDFVNKGIMECLNIKAKYASTDTLPTEAQTETFSEDVVPFLSSHLSMTDDKILPVLSGKEPQSESCFQTVNEDLTSESLHTKLTSFKANNGKYDLKTSSKQDIFAEFEKEIKMTEHLEPHTSVRKVHGSWKRMDSSGSEDMNKKESKSLPADIFSTFERSEKLSNGSSDEITHRKDDTTEELISINNVAEETNAKQDNEEVLTSETESSQKEGETEPRRPSLIRRNTFELDPDDDRLALLRQEYERRQGNLLFQSCIPQFSGHLTGSEGFRDAQSLTMVSSANGEDLNVDEMHQRSLPVVPGPVSALPSTTSYEKQIIVTDASHLVLPTRMFENREIHTPDSLNNDGPLDSLFNAQIHQIVESQQRYIHPFHELEKRESEYQVDDSNGTFKKDIKDNSKTESLENEDKSKYQKDEMKRMSSSFDNSTKPVISGALTCSDVVVDEKRSCDSPKKQKRTESTPIVSGGVSSSDFVVPARPVSESPIMARRKNESAPILSGGAPMMEEPEPDKVESKPVSSVKSAWVVDMSDCGSFGGKPPLEPRKQKKNEIINNGVHSPEQTDALHKQNEIKAAPALGFFVDLKESENQMIKKPLLKDRKEINNEKDSKNIEFSPARRNSGVGFFVDLKEDPESSDKRLISEGKELSFEDHTEEKSLAKNVSCGFFIHLKENDHKKPITESVPEIKKPLDNEVEKKTPSSDKKNAIFSMFIDIGEPGNKQETPSKQGSVESLRSKVSSPHLSTHKKLGFKNSIDTPDSISRTTTQTVEGTESPKSTFMYIEANPPPTRTSASSKSTSQEEIEHKENKKQGFFMFIETDSPVTRRKTLPSGLRPNLNRHSWNLEPRIGEQSDEQQKGNGKRHHKRAHSLSVERGSVCSPSDDSKSSSTASLAKNKMRGSSQSLHETIVSPEQGSLTHFGDVVSVKPMSSSCHSRLPSKSFDRLPKRTLSYEGKSDSGKETPDIDTISEGKMLGEEDFKQDSDDQVTTKSQNSDLTSEESGTVPYGVMEKSSIPTLQKSASAKEVPITLKLENGSKQIHIKNKNSKIVIDSGQESSSLESGVEADMEKDDQCSESSKHTLETKREIESKSLETSFVKLSDLDKEPPKSSGNDTENGDVLPSFAMANRMTRSIPETSWIESKLLMTRSIGGGTSSKSLSRLFPHLHTTGSVTSSPSNIGRSKSPNTQAEVDDNDTQISETSDLSSMQSSMGPSGLEGSTEETDASSSYAGRSGPVSRLGEDLLRMFLEEINPDVTVEVGGRRLKAHKCILSSRCQYFAAILSGGWVESAGNVISLQGFSYNAVHFALCHIYSGTSNIPDTISIVELATLADMLGLEGLKEVIMYTLKVKYCHFFHKTVDNILETVMCCDKLLATLPNVRWAEPVFGITSQLLEASIKFIANNFCGVLSSDRQSDTKVKEPWMEVTLMKRTLTCTSCMAKRMALHFRLHDCMKKLQPERRTFTRLHQRLRENGSFAHHVREGRPRSITPDVEERVLDIVHERPSTSTRIATQERVLSHLSVWRILHRQLLYPYHLQRVQALNNADFPPRENFSFLSLGKELSWNISRLEDSLMAATDRLPPDQACQSHTRLHNILTVAQSPEPPPEMHWSPNFVELLRRIQKRVEASLVRQAPRAARCPSWNQMELELRKKIQEAACLVLVPGEEGRRSRHASLARHGESGSGNSVYCTAPRSVSSTGSRSLDIRQVKLAMTQQARRAASGGRVSTLRADTKSRSQSSKKSQQSSTHVPPHKAETVASQAKKVVQENGESTSRPKTWPLRVLENKPRTAKQRANSSSSSMGTPEKSGAMPRRTGKTMISSSDSSRTSSPAMRRSTSSGEGSGRGRAATVGSSSSRNLLRRSETPPGKEIRSKKRKDGDVTMSTDSLSEPHSNGGCKRSVKEMTDSITSRSCISTRPDTPSVRRKLREEVTISTDSLTESVASGEKATPKVETSLSAPSRSLGSTRPDTPPVKERGRKCLGRIGVDVSMSTDSLTTTEQTLTGESAAVRKMEVNKIVNIPRSPTPKGSQLNRLEGSKGNLAKGTKANEAKNENSQPRSPATAARRVVMRQTIVSPRDSPTFRLRSGISSSPFTGSPSLRRSLLLASRSPTNDNTAAVNNNTKMATPTKATTMTPAKTEKVVVKSLSSPSTSVTVNKRTPTRLQTRNQPVASPVKSGSGVTCRASGREAGKSGTPCKAISNTSKANNNAATRKVVSNGSINGRNKQNNNEVSSQNKKAEPSEDRPLTVGSRSGTFLKDEPTILKKPDVDNVQE
ncbi:hypothetical protein C0J52_16579 [Blattella germanica]|nr:hypothetical protein C0J52_16579 [Blattella germanica]